MGLQILHGIGAAASLITLILILLSFQYLDNKGMSILRRSSSQTEKQRVEQRSQRLLTNIISLSISVGLFKRKRWAWIAANVSNIAGAVIVFMQMNSPYFFIWIGIIIIYAVLLNANKKFYAL